MEINDMNRSILFRVFVLKIFSVICKLVLSRCPFTSHRYFFNREQKSRRQRTSVKWLGRLWHHRVWELRVWTQTPLSHERAHGDHRWSPQRTVAKTLHSRSAGSWARSHQKLLEIHRRRLRTRPSARQNVFPAAGPSIIGQQTPHLVSGPDRDLVEPDRVLLMYA